MTSNEEAIRDARSHIDKGTGLSDEAVKRICVALLSIATPSVVWHPLPEMGAPFFCEVEGCGAFAEANLRRCRAHEGGFLISVTR